ncbi:hypothetical protein MSAN_02121800 [Mycena sanguinolenta]|uniref:DUF6699 domain-containing protein n=1 Tax=Mycena sanguinolenta TaxID=230812 RepID=A0A8H6XHF9_9AGAR|nr:hypothetical protein MSAN_02121800 [Mycena sanguinolenta]
MPGKHVRFSTENTFHSPAPLLSSLPGPTPYVPHRSYTYSSAANARAHNLVAFADSPLLNFDISLPPSAITTHFHGVSSAGFQEPAVYPPQSTISIVTQHLPWSITVAASNGRYVTVADTLNALHRSLRTNVTGEEYHTLGSHTLKHRATEAYTHRYMRLQGHRGYTEEKRGGLKRVDFLMGCTQFRGLSATGAADVWRLHIS